jgi:hypothetical protein
VKLLPAGFLLLAVPALAQNRFEPFDRDLKRAATELHISDLRAVVVESGRVVWSNGSINTPAPEEPVIAERAWQLARRGRISLNDPVTVPGGATIRQVLANTADGTPGQEVLENRMFFSPLEQIVGMAPFPNAVQFVIQGQGTLGWFHQEYAREQIFWSYEPSLIVLKVPSKKLALLVSANSDELTKAARLQDGNIARSTVVLAFLRDIAGLKGTQRDELVDRALSAKSDVLLRRALDEFPELASVPDVTLLYLFAEMGFPETESSATAVIRDHPTLPTAWFYYGHYLENNKRYREAAACFEKITQHEPPWHHWTVTAAQKELGYLKTH